MLNNFFAILQLIRLKAYAGFLLCFFPACIGLALNDIKLVDLKFILIFFIGSIVSRGAGCVINDIFDRDFDRKVARTKSRPLASRQLSIYTALVVLLVCTILSFAITALLPQRTWNICVIAIVLIILYPLTKRITYFPQIFLGCAFNIGTLIAYLCRADHLSRESIILYISCCFWTMYYDTIYGFMDIRDDKLIGVKSLSILLEYKKPRIWLALFYVAFISLYYLANYLATKEIIVNIYFNLGVIIGLIVFIYQIKNLDIHNSQNCMLIFKSNIYIGFILTLSLTIAKLVY